MCKANPDALFQRHADTNNAMTVPPKGETVVISTPAREARFDAAFKAARGLPRDWANADPVFSYGQGHANSAEAIAFNARGEAATQERVSAPPRASLGQKVGLVLGAAWNRLCDRHMASCAILIAVAVFVAIGATLDGLSRLFT